MSLEIRASWPEVEGFRPVTAGAPEPGLAFTKIEELLYGSAIRLAEQFAVLAIHAVRLLERRKAFIGDEELVIAIEKVG